MIESRLFLMEVRGRPQRPLEGARVVFLLSFGGFLVKRSFEDAIDCSGTIEVWVWAEVDMDAEPSSCNSVEDDLTMLRPMRVLSYEAWLSLKINGLLVDDKGRTLILGIFCYDLSLILLPSSLSVRCFILVLELFFDVVCEILLSFKFWFSPGVSKLNDDGVSWFYSIIVRFNSVIIWSVDVKFVY